MERVAFLLEESGERLRCLLNPESVVLRRRAGVRTRRSGGALVSGGSRANDQLLFTGGGSTELTLDLLFDVQLAGSSIATEDVRDLTGPLWALAENSRSREGHQTLPLCRFIWGKAWNIPGVVTAVAERLEYFTAAGVPRRSWLRLRMRRVDEPTPEIGGAALAPGTSPAATQFPGRELPVGPGGGRLDLLAQDQYDDATLGRPLAEWGGLDDLLRNPVGTVLETPPRSLLEDES